MIRVEQVSANIWCIKAWLLIPLRVWIVREEDGVTLVDAGMPFMTNRIMAFIKQLNAGPLKRILLTHGHSDHVGAVKKSQRQNLYQSLPIESRFRIWKGKSCILVVKSWK